MFSSYSPSSAYARSRARAERVYSDLAASYLDLAASATQSIQTTTADKKALLYYRRAHSEPPALPCAAHKAKVDVAASVQQSAIAHKKKEKAAMRSTRVSPEPDTRKIWRDYSSRGYGGVDSDCEMDAHSDHYFASRESTPDDVDVDTDALLSGMGELGLDTSPFSACSAQAISTSLRLIEQQLQATLLLDKPDYRDPVINAHNDEEPADVDARPMFIREDTPELAASPTSSVASLPDFGNDMPQDADDVNMDDALAQLSAMSIFPKIPSLDEYTDADVREIHEALKSGPVPVQLLLDAFPICERAGWPEFPVRAPSPPSPSRSQEAVAARRAEKRCKAAAPYNTRARTRVVVANTEYPLRPVLSWD